MLDGDEKAEPKDEPNLVVGARSAVASVEAVPVVPTKSRRGRHKKPKDMPSRPLSAYNIFFSKEREKILSANRQGLEQSDFLYPSEAELEQQASSGKKKPPALFQALAKCVGGRWRALIPDDRRIYEDQAKEEMRIYREKMATYQESMVMKSIAESVKSGDLSSESEAPEGKPPAKKAKTSSDNAGLKKAALQADFEKAGHKADSLDKDDALPPHDQILLKQESLASPQIPPSTDSASDLSLALQMPFQQYMQQRPGARQLHSGTVGELMDASIGLQSASQQRFAGTRGLPSSTIPFYSQQLLHNRVNIPRSALSQNQSDILLCQQAIIQQHQLHIQRALLGPSPGLSAASFHQLQQQQIQRAQAGQVFPSLFLQNAPHRFVGGPTPPAGYAMDVLQPGAALTGASPGYATEVAQLEAALSGAGAGVGGEFLMELVMRSQQQQQQQP